ncbi:unnamed protein product [Prunus brigantina]
MLGFGVGSGIAVSYQVMVVLLLGSPKEEGGGVRSAILFLTRGKMSASAGCPLFNFLMNSIALFLAHLVSRSGILRGGCHWLEEAYVSGRLNWMLLPKKSKRS